MKCSPALLGAAAPARLTSDGYLKGSGSSAFKTAVQTSTLAPQWGDALCVCVDLAAVLGDVLPGDSGDSNDSGGEEGRPEASGAGGEKEPFCGVTIEVWDAPTVAGHTFLGCARLGRAQLAALLAQPVAAPLVLPLQDDPACGRGAARKPAAGVVSVHVVASALPPGWLARPKRDGGGALGAGAGEDEDDAHGRGGGESAAHRPWRDPAALAPSPDGAAGHRQAPPEAQADAPPDDPLLAEERARVELLIRETARQNIEARHLAETAAAAKVTSNTAAPYDVL